MIRIGSMISALANVVSSIGKVLRRGDALVADELVFFAKPRPAFAYVI